MAVRMKDIARDLGVSVVTISKVLRNHADISEETRARVLQRIKELDYRPNLTARALITGRSSTIGLVVPDLLHPFFAQIAKAIFAVLREKGYALLISCSEDDPELERQEIAQLLARRVDALLIASAQVTTAEFQRLDEQRVKYVLIDRQFAGLAANFVGMDDVGAGLLATSHLVEQGCRSIAHIRGPEVSTAIGRLEGFQKALCQAGMEVLPQHIVSAGTSPDHRGEPGGYEAVKALLATDPRPDGIFCYNDPLAMGALRAILDAGLRVPQDIAVVGCGNLSYSDFLRVPLSTIDQGSALIGQQAGELALTMVEARKPRRTETIVAEPKLVARASSLRLPA